MSPRPRPPWWRVIDWRVVVAVGLPAWYAAGAVVVVAHAGRSQPEAARPADPPNVALPPPTPQPTPDEPPPAARPAAPPPPAFSARLIDGGGAVEADAPNAVWRRGRGGREWAGPPAAIDGWTTYGTFVPWRGSPAEAMERAAVAAKLVLIVHSSGSAADDDWFTDTHPRAFRNRVLADRRVGAEIDARYVAAVQKVVTPKSVPGGAVACYFCAPDGRVIHAVPGVTEADAFREEARWAAGAFDAAAGGSGGDDAALRRAVRAAHADRLRRAYGFVLPFDLVPRLDRKAQPAARLLDHPGVAGLPSVGRAHALLAADPLPRLDDFYPVVWGRVLAGPPAP